jgi:hypothetical protein
MLIAQGKASLRAAALGSTAPNFFPCALGALARDAPSAHGDAWLGDPQYAVHTNGHVIPAQPSRSRAHAHPQNPLILQASWMMTNAMIITGK